MTLSAKNKIKLWRDDPVAFVRENFQVEPDAWQVEFLTKYNQNPRTAAKACKGPGKTAVLAWCAWHFLSTRPFPKIAATSISGDNLSDGLWAEMAKWQHKSEFLKAAFVWTKTRIYAADHPETWFMSARQWSKSADKDQQANTLAGLHADYIMFIMDEAGGIPDAVAAAAEAALATGIECKLLICGNPTHLTGPLYRACTTEASDWQVIEITGDPDAPNRSPRISIEWARKQIRAYGADNPWVLVNVFGRFPPASLNALLGPDDVKAAMNRSVPLKVYVNSPKVLGGDVARQGDDAQVLFPRQGVVAFKPKMTRIPDLMQLAGQWAQSIKKWIPDAVFIDATGGFGHGVIDPLRSWGYDVVDVQFSGKALRANQFFNKRSEMLWDMAQWVKAGGCIPNIPELLEELTALEYTFKGDKILVIPKEQVKEKIGRSPDYSDALALTFAYPVNPQTPIDRIKARMAQNSPDPNPLDGVFEQAPHQGIADWNPLQ